MDRQLPNAEVGKRQKAGERIAEVLRRQIIRGEIRSGEAFPAESVLLEHFGVSRPSLREAFRILESESLITVHTGPGGGARVHELDPAVASRHFGLLLQYRGVALADLYEARVDIETASVARLCQSRTERDLDRLDAAVAASAEASSDPAAYTVHEAAFSELLVELSGNTTLMSLAGVLYDVIRIHYRSFGTTHSGAQGRRAARAAQRTHVELVELVRERDEERARKLWETHLADVARYVRDDLDKTLVEVLS